MIADLSPGLILILGALFVPLIPGRARKIYLLALPLLAGFQLYALDPGLHGQIGLFDFTLTTLRVDRLSTIFGAIFLIASFYNTIYALHERDTMQDIAALVYAGAAIGAVFAGDLITLFVFWEITAVSSVFLIWARRTRRAYHAGLRYLIIQVGSGVLLLAGTILYAARNGTIAFNDLGLVDTATTLIFFAFAIKCAFPLLHNWLQDAYPEATVTGTVVLSAFTTKLAVYALARGYAGTESLIYIGAIMTAFPVFFAVIENDLRRVLSFSLNNQLGFMVAGIGVGTPLALNGAVAHAFVHIIYKSLLFMSMGAVLHRTGTIKASELGGLYRSMPLTTIFCIIGAASISAFPLFSGFVTKSLTLSAVAENGYLISWLVLVFASAGVLEHSGIKIPYFAFFAHDRGLRCREAPTNMLVAMGIAAFFSIAIGIYPAPLYALLPYEVDYQPYTGGHVLTQLQLLLFAMLAFALLVRSGLYPEEIPSTNLNTDWIYRKAAPALIARITEFCRTVRQGAVARAQRRLERFLIHVYRHYGPDGIMARTWSTGSTVLWVAMLLGVYLFLFYV
ncbi:MAG: Na(+)/H(+) antiporter subunit D [Alphaproteobacteria bacterium]|nr:MAG: Na(+)/H(+) antiporter subunit D [Alphaproteobacteria bacterium]